jgi:hypothetical protein
MNMLKIPKLNPLAKTLEKIVIKITDVIVTIPYLTACFQVHLSSVIKSAASTMDKIEANKMNTRLISKDKKLNKDATRVITEYVNVLNAAGLNHSEETLKGSFLMSFLTTTIPL